MLEKDKREKAIHTQYMYMKNKEHINGKMELLSQERT